MGLCNIELLPVGLERYWTYVRLGLVEFVVDHVFSQLMIVLSHLMGDLSHKMGFFHFPVRSRPRNVQTCLIFELDA